MKNSATTRACIFATRYRSATEILMDLMEEKGLVTYVGKINMDRSAPDELVEESTDYPPEEIYSEYYPVGLYKATVRGIKKGNAALILAHVKKGEGIETATQIYMSSFYVDENNMLTLVTEEDAMFLINK